MPQLQTKLSERIANKRRAKSRNINVAFADVPKMVDVLFIGCDGEHLGEVVAKASPAGREAVEKLFPGTHTEWRDDLGPDAAFFPDDWKEFTFVIAGLLRDLPRFGSKHNLPKHLIELRPSRILAPISGLSLWLSEPKIRGLGPRFGRSARTS